MKHHIVDPCSQSFGSGGGSRTRTLTPYEGGMFPLHYSAMVTLQRFELWF